MVEANFRAVLILLSFYLIDARVCLKSAFIRPVKYCDSNVVNNVAISRSDIFRPILQGQSLCRRRSVSRSSLLMMASPSDPMTIRRTSSIWMQRSTWLSWWAQTILSVVSTVTLFFANAVKGNAQSNIITNGIFLAGIGLSLSFINIVWTWAYGNIARNLPTAIDNEKGVRNLQRTVKVGVIIALSGMLITLIGAEQIVGTLVAKSVSGAIVMTQGGPVGASAAMQLQALDIFVVQANTNTLLSHLSSIINSLYITTLRWPPAAKEAPEITAAQ